MVYVLHDSRGLFPVGILAMFQESLLHFSGLFPGELPYAAGSLKKAFVFSRLFISAIINYTNPMLYFQGRPVRQKMIYCRRHAESGYTMVIMTV